MSEHALTHPAALAGGPASAEVRFVHASRFLPLPVGAAMAIVWANTFAESYFIFARSITFIVNDLAMVLFFGLLALEIREEVMPGGALHTWRRWTVPLIAAVGGTICAPLVFLLYVGLGDQRILFPAWPVLCAVDLVTSYYVVKALHARRGLLAFTLLTAIASDAIAILTIMERSQFSGVQPLGTVLIAIAVAYCAVLRHRRVNQFLPYFVVGGTLSWIGFYLDGLLPALALIPLVPFLPHEPRRLDTFSETPDDDPTHHAEHEWDNVVQVVLFFFGLVNAGVNLRGYDTGTWAMVIAALVGRPLGMMLGIGIAVIAGLHVSAQLRWRELVVSALATASGFAMALFFAVTIVPVGPTLAQLKFGALVVFLLGPLLAFLSARLLGVGVLRRRRLPHNHREHSAHGNI